MPEGAVGFLIETSHAAQGWTRYRLADRPAVTNQSCRPVLHGWCGSYNDVSTYGRGLVGVTKVLPNGRVRVRELLGDELARHLEGLGFPELTPSEEG
jgi:hypothetical protein